MNFTCRFYANRYVLAHTLQIKTLHILTTSYIQVLFPELRLLELSSIHLEEMTRFSGRLTNIQPTSSRFQNLLSLTVKGCSYMRYLLSFSTARAMVQLQILQVVECKDIEEILTKDFGEEEIASPVELFPRLQNLFLQHLPILERFCI